ncbi:tautomerase family protein [Cucumibacter marinus]|uniref:tautomerase family protein n=1 Tax=Cucumibacter marinus TaxID=1121252 RepID=UPI00048CD1CB|nr:4-oxalocrotonate tautomerase family protein [Cucumibacter marinus]
MPYVNIKITREGGPTGTGPSAEQKARLIEGVTALLQDVLGKDPKTTVVVIDEVEMDNWGIGGLPVDDFRKQSS